MYPSANNQTYVSQRQGAGPLPLTSNPPRRRADMLLTDAIKHGQAQDMLQLINDALAAGADLQYCHTTQQSRLEIAVLANNLAAFQTLLAKGAQLPNVGVNGKDLLMLAAEHGSVDILAHLLKTREIDARYTDHFGQTALMYAVRHGSSEAVTALLQSQADVDAATFHDAHSHGTAVFGFDTDYSGEDVTALMIAAALGNKPIVELLLEFGADVSCGTHDFPLSIAAQTSDLDILRCLLAHNPATSRRDKEGLTPLHLAIREGADPDCIAALIEQTDIEVRTDTQAHLTPLGLAISLQNVEITALLIEKNASLQALGNPGVTPWQLLPSRANVKPEMLDLLVFATGPASFSSSGDAAKLLDQMITAGSWMRHQSQFGLFHKLVTAIEPLLLTVINNPRGLPRQPAPHAMQLQMRMAHAIVNSGELTALTSVAPLDPGQAGSPAARCDRRISNATTTQVHALITATRQRLSTVCLDVLHNPAMALKSRLPDPDSASDFTVAELARLLRQENGLPAALAAQLAECWRDAVTLSLEVFDPHHNRAEQERYLQKLLPLLLASDLLPGKYASRGSFEAHLTETLTNGTADATTALHAFLADPPKVLRAIEQRHSLRDVNRDSLRQALYLQTGLPPDCVNPVVDAWAAGIAAVKKMPGVSTPAQLNNALSMQFAKALSHRLQSIEDQDSEYLQALQTEVMTALSTWYSAYQPPLSEPARNDAPERSRSNSISSSGSGSGGSNKRAGPDNPEPDSAGKRQRN